MPVLNGEALDANVLDAVTSAITLTTEKTITLYVCNDSGRSLMHRIGLEVSPVTVGDVWCAYGSPINGEGVETYTLSAERVRAKVLEAEGAASTAMIYIDAH